jgi:hypothetical protein
MEYQCAWCGLILAPAQSPGCSNISHGICEAYNEDMLADLDSLSELSPRQAKTVLGAREAA